MDQVGENVSASEPFMLLAGNPLQYPLVWRESTADYTCRLCMKTFYNKKALQNHKKAQHDDDGSDGEYQQKPIPLSEQNINGLCGFKFIPLHKSTNDEQVIGRDGFITRTFTEDTSYLIIKIERHEMDADAVKRSRLDGVVKRAQMKPKLPIDLSQIFLDSAEYDEHNRIVHAKMKPHQCSICAKRFTQQGGLQQHMRMHTGVRPFVCTFCPKAFTQKAGLDQHLRTHTKVKPFKCVICSKCFSQSVHLRQHMRTHTNIQPFECSVCGRRFKQSSHLNFHMRSHVGDSNLAVENYVPGEGQDGQMEFLDLTNLQPVQDGDTLYYTTELAVGSVANQNAYAYQPQVIVPDNVLSL
ncbi:hypothetical protein PYW08_000210 [Mythimna loreyi]|uniref:Uncharacterized protein n=1 Tax=Mythimna loreyi TaxID=667449 RepID=A0ACC2RAY5_9NEOP|nr:hypothetical protein PYW08_000210 [Mythimna loreyi]